VDWKTAQGWFAETSLLRHAAEACFRAASRCHLARLDRRNPARCQRRILLGLLNQARSTRFGLDHDFRRIRTIADFRRLVPTRTRADLWRQYGHTEANDSGHAIALQTAHRHALRTALALVVRDRPHSRLLSGALLFPGEEGPSSLTERSRLPERIPSLVRAYSRMGADTLAERCAHWPVTCLVGPLERMLPLLENVKQVHGKNCLTDVWPGLTAVLYTRRSAAAPVERLCEQTGNALLLEMTVRAEGPIAVEDPRFGLPRLLFDHGTYFEFVLPAQASGPGCPRLGIDEIELGVPYELILTSPAGLWACRSGRIVCLERRDPPLVRFVEVTTSQAIQVLERRPARRTDLIVPTAPLPAPHPPNGGTPAMPPENSFHTPWSTHADRE
jgi:hypothetical protein